MSRLAVLEQEKFDVNLLAPPKFGKQRCPTFAFSQGHLFLVLGKRVAVKESAAGCINLAVIPWQADVSRLRTLTGHLYVKQVQKWHSWFRCTIPLYQYVD